MVGSRSGLGHILGQLNVASANRLWYGVFRANSTEIIGVVTPRHHTVFEEKFVSVSIASMHIVPMLSVEDQIVPTCRYCAIACVPALAIAAMSTR
jgi:hypothetical protein